MMLRLSRIVLVTVITMMVPCAATYASEQHPSVREVASMVTCPSCSSTVDQDRSPAAQRMRAYIREKVAAGWTRKQVLDGLVAQYGGDRSIITATRDSGRRSLLVWGIPVVVLVVLTGIGWATVRRWSAATHTSSRSDVPEPLNTTEL